MVNNVGLTVVPPLFLLVSDRVPSHERLAVYNQRNSLSACIITNMAFYIMSVGCVPHSLERRSDFSSRIERGVRT